MFLTRAIKITLLLAILLFLSVSKCWSGSRAIKFEVQSLYDIIEISGELDYQLQGYDLREYDREGYLIKEGAFTSLGRLWIEVTYKYDEKRNRIERVARELETNESSKFVYSYDDEGNQVEEKVYYSEKLQLKSLSSYDDYGNMIEKNWYDSEGKWTSIRTYEYDQWGNSLREVFRHEDGHGHEIVYVYDDSGNMLKKTEYSLEGNLSRRYVYEYDERGDQVGETYYEGDTEDDIGYRFVYVRNASGEVRERLFYWYELTSGELREIPKEKTIYEYFYFEDDVEMQ